MAVSEMICTTLFASVPAWTQDSSDLTAPRGWIGGEPGEPPDDGRARILNQPGIVEVRVLDRMSMRFVAVTRSGDGGVWAVDGLLLSHPLLVLGVDVNGQVNAAVQDWIYPVSKGS